MARIGATENVDLAPADPEILELNYIVDKATTDELTAN
jgi:hypothetical protein